MDGWKKAMEERARIVQETKPDRARQLRHGRGVACVAGTIMRKWGDRRRNKSSRGPPAFGNSRAAADRCTSRPATRSTHLPVRARDLLAPCAQQAAAPADADAVISDELPS